MGKTQCSGGFRPQVGGSKPHDKGHLLPLHCHFGSEVALAAAVFDGVCRVGVRCSAPTRACPPTSSSGTERIADRVGLRGRREGTSMTHKRVIEVFAKLVGKRLASSCPGGTRRASPGRSPGPPPKHRPQAAPRPRRRRRQAAAGPRRLPRRARRGRRSPRGPAAPQGYRYSIALSGATALRRVTPGRRPRRILADVSSVVSVRARVPVIALGPGGAFAARYGCGGRGGCGRLRRWRPGRRARG